MAYLIDDDRLILEALPYESSGRGLFMVYESYTYGGVEVPVGFVTDLCSIPGFARVFLPTAGRVSKPAVLHDYLISLDEIDAANEVFPEALREAGVSPTSRVIMVAAVKAYWWLKRRGIYWASILSQNTAPRYRASALPEEPADT